jgi:hypothetical protein
MTAQGHQSSVHLDLFNSVYFSWIENSLLNQPSAERGSVRD